MGDWGASLVGRLEARAALAALLAGGGGGIDWNTRPEDRGKRSVVLQTVSDPRPDHYGGAQGLRWTRVQADCWSAHSADEAARIAEEVIAAVRPDPGTDGADDAGAWVQDGVQFQRPEIDGPVDSGEQGEVLYQHRSRLDLLLWHSDEGE